MYGPRPTAPEVRFQRFIKKTDTCWLWIGGDNGKGYGSFIPHKVDGKWRSMLAHRYAYTLWVGPIPDGLHVCHSCDVRKCVNPWHLWLGTNTDNQIDSVRKGRHSTIPATEVDSIRAADAAGVSTAELARHYGVATVTIRQLINRHTFASIP